MIEARPFEQGAEVLGCSMSWQLLPRHVEYMDGELGESTRILRMAEDVAEELGFDSDSALGTAIADSKMYMRRLMGVAGAN